ncbi:hypothetical protein [Haloferula sp. BvORR071]|uniref:hypothetical protein n=1 Tax=Haloferula sp. BvORR071 TaxID=1396141 RepID=UPI000552EAE6|nr:hypothetical protein [Haloferula sp. BvORR071]
MIEEKVQRTNRTSLGLLVASIVVFAAFNLLPWDPRSPQFEVGWKIWPTVLSPSNWRQSGNLLPTMGLLTGVLLIVGGPFLVPLLRSSRLLWWTAALVGGLGLGSVLLSMFAALAWSQYPLSPGVAALILSLALNFAGIISIRRHEPGSSMERPDP